MTVECQTIASCGRYDGSPVAVFPKRARTSVMPQQFMRDLTLNQNGYEVVPISRLMRSFELRAESSATGVGGGVVARQLGE